MQPEHSQTPEDSLAERLKLVRALDAGTLDSIECPECHANAVTVRFTRPIPGEFRTWFLCTNCAFKLRIFNPCPPKNYSAERLDEQLEAYDFNLIQMRKLNRSDE